jgi:hypothetical protein
VQKSAAQSERTPASKLAKWQKSTDTDLYTLQGVLYHTASPILIGYRKQSRMLRLECEVILDDFTH